MYTNLYQISSGGPCMSVSEPFSPATSTRSPRKGTSISPSRKSRFARKRAPQRCWVSDWAWEHADGSLERMQVALVADVASNKVPNTPLCLSWPDTQEQIMNGWTRVAHCTGKVYFFNKQAQTSPWHRPELFHVFGQTLPFELGRCNLCNHP